MNIIAMFFKNRFRSCITLAIIGMIFSGCSTDDNKNNTSEDVGALKAIVQIPGETTSVRWEIFSTPEYTGGVPGPTDYMTLVAELNADDRLWAALPNEGTAHVNIVPEAARPWLSNDLRLLLERSKNANLTVSNKNDCKPYATRMTKTGRQVNGFICKGTNRLLLYMMVLSRSPG